MASPQFERRLAAVLAADVVGYSRLMGADEAGTLARLKALRKDLIEPQIAGHRGRIVKFIGDGVLVEFASVVDAVQCAIAIQNGSAERNTATPAPQRIVLRIGIHLGDVIVENDDIYGDGVNLAARIETLAEPGGICLSQQAFDQVENKVDARFSYVGEQRVKNIAKAVRVHRVEVGTGVQPRAGGEVADDSTTARPAIAVLPFANLSGDPEQEYFADGLSEELITALSHWRSFPVIARNSSFTYKGRAIKVQDVGRELGVRYLLEGSVRKAGMRVRITAQLIDAGRGHHLWAEKFDRQLEDIFDIQDEISRRIAATIAPELEQAELRKSVAKRTEDLTAWDFYVRGMPHFYEETCEGNARARELFRRAIERDPGYVDAWARLGWTYLRDIGNGCTDDRDGALANGFGAARRALALDDASAVAHLCLGTAYVWSEQLELGLQEAKQALALDPSYAHAALALGNRLDLLGRTEEGIAEMEKGLQLSPRDPHRWLYMIYLARAQVSRGDYEAALQWARRAVQLRPDHPDAHYRLAVCLAHLDRRDEARAALEECERVRPGFVMGRAGWRPYPDDQRNRHYFAGLHRLGLITSVGP